MQPQMTFSFIKPIQKTALPIPINLIKSRLSIRIFSSLRLAHCQAVLSVLRGIRRYAPGQNAAPQRSSRTEIYDRREPVGVFLSQYVRQSFIRFFPVDNMPKGLDKFSPVIFIIQVVGVLEYIDHHNDSEQGVDIYVVLFDLHDEESLRLLAIA
jgi:hypothetical protein